jgi:hypothetical protein
MPEGSCAVGVRGPDEVQRESRDVRQSSKMRLGAEVCAAAAAGWAAVLLSAIPPRPGGTESVFLPLMAEAVELMAPVSILLLFGVGVVAGLVGRGPTVVLGLATVACLPLWSLMDVLSGGRGHNLLPVEWVSYGLIGLVGVAGAVIGRNRGLKPRLPKGGFNGQGEVRSQ